MKKNENTKSTKPNQTKQTNKLLHRLLLMNPHVAKQNDDAEEPKAAMKGSQANEEESEKREEEEEKEEKKSPEVNGEEPPDPSELLPEGWIAIRHVKEKKDFFYHQGSQSITWSRPYRFNSSQEILQTHVVQTPKPRGKLPTKSKGVHQENPGKKDTEKNLEAENVSRPMVLEETKKTRVLLRLAGTNEASYFFLPGKVGSLATLKTLLADKYPKVLTSSCKKISLVKQSSGELVELGENLPEILPGDCLEVFIKGNWLPSIEGKNEGMLLTEFCENVLQCKLEYQESTTNAAQAGFRAMVVVAGKGYSSASGGTKKQARQKAAAKTLSILLPSQCQDPQHHSSIADLSVLDSLLIQDAEVCPPSQVPSLETSLRALTRPHTYFRTPVPIARSEEEARGYFLAEFPEIQTWGQLARYLIEVEGSLVPPRGQASAVDPKQSAVELAKVTKTNRPNQALLDKLKEEMKKLS